MIHSLDNKTISLEFQVLLQFTLSLGFLNVMVLGVGDILYGCMYFEKVFGVTGYCLHLSNGMQMLDQLFNKYIQRVTLANMVALILMDIIQKLYSHLFQRS